MGEGKEVKTGKIIGMSIELNRRNCFLGTDNSVGKMMHQYLWEIFWPCYFGCVMGYGAFGKVVFKIIPPVHFSLSLERNFPISQKVITFFNSPTSIPDTLVFFFLSR